MEITLRKTAQGLKTDLSLAPILPLCDAPARGASKNRSIILRLQAPGMFSTVLRSRHTKHVQEDLVSSLYAGLKEARGDAEFTCDRWHMLLPTSGVWTIKLDLIVELSLELNQLFCICE